MPLFDFSISKKKEKNTKRNYSSNNYIIIEQVIDGVVFIDLNANYTIKVNGINYNIKSDNYNCKGVSKVYRQLLYNKQRVIYVRLDDNKCSLGNNLYLPFAPGCIVKGNIIEHKYLKNKLFDIKKVYVDYDNPIAQEAIEFYRANYNQIQEKLILKNE